MEHHLAASAERADYLVELSNVVRDTSFIGRRGPRSLRRLGLVLRALMELTGDPDVSVYLVADSSLLGGHREFGDQAEVRRLRDWVADGLVEEVDDADERVLELARMTSLPVVTGDQYVDHRLEHPWIQGNTWQFLKPEARPDGSVALVTMDMGVRSAAEISRRMELSALKKQGLLGPSRTPLTEVIMRTWRCPELRCTLYDIRKGERILLPRMRRGAPTCELHGAPLVDEGPRLGTTQLKAVIDGTCVARYTLDEGSEAYVGRLPGQVGIALHSLLPPQVAQQVSRRHVAVSARSGAVLIRDISTYGTRMRRAGRHGAFGPWEKLPPQTDRPFRPGDEVELSSGVVLTRSGRRFPAELADAWRAEAAGAPVTPTATAPTRRA
ncbi:FHA domain-containing protein [Streptomyces lateritius]|uniref:FHA domain-containing protein n=1 Tax=Streptomyces lateritius TaxID=67313 RepID=UPI001C8CDE73|nr:FHA domain-containing protein [Streptomyces lateritius]MBX9427012.1 FHA domain-containing protein [Streptomyces lateritius]